MSNRLSQGHTELGKYADLKLILKLRDECSYTQSDLDKLRAWVLGKKIQEITY